MLLMGFVGMVIESAQASITAKKLIYKGDRFFYNFPIVFIYAVGGTFFYYTTKTLVWMPWYKVILSLALIASVWEYVAGYFCEHIAKKKFWDYSSRRFNIFGYISLWSMMWWLVFAAIFYFFVFEKLLSMEVNLSQNIWLSQEQGRTIFGGMTLTVLLLAIKRIKEYSATSR